MGGYAVSSVAPDGTETEPSSDQAPAAGAAPDEPGRLAGFLLTAVFIMLTVAALAVFVPLPYVVMKPGPATNTLGDLGGKPVIEVKDGTKTYPTSGELDFTTVSVLGGPGVNVNIYDVLGGWLSSSQVVLHQDQVFPDDATEKQVQHENQVEMTGSQQVAAATALRALGKTVPESVSVAAVPTGSPATGALQAGDVLLKVDGTAVTSADSLRTAVQAHKPGEKLVIEVRRAGTTQTVTTTTGASDGTTVIGILLAVGYDLPVDVVVNAGDIGGPSAGMMFALGIYDILSPGPLTGGKDIAGTGTLAADGSVGPIGGIQQKLVGARDGGVQWFLAPAANCNEVVGHVPSGLHIVKVTSFDAALAAVKEIAAGTTASLPTCTAG